jgi:hypothetical protein
MKQETITVAELADILAGKKKLPPPDGHGEITPGKRSPEDWVKLPKNKSLLDTKSGLGAPVKQYVAKFDVYEYFRSVRGESPSPEKDRKKPGHEESQLQQLCVAWFRSEFPAIAPLLIAVPNAARRNARTGAILKREGLTAGVADLILLVGRGEYHSLCIEMKTHRKGSGQSDKQIEWEQVAEENGNKYVVCRDLEEFKITVLNYLFP